MGSRQSYQNILYLLLTFPLGLVYFVLLVPGLVLSLSLTIAFAWIGVFIFIGLIRSCWGVASFERYLAERLLHLSLPALTYAETQQMTPWKRLMGRFGHPMTWKILAFLLLKFPLGLFVFVVTIVLLPLSVTVGLLGLLLGLLTGPFYLLILCFTGLAHAGARLRRYLLLSLGGFGLILLTFAILNGLALMMGWITRLMLGMSSTALQLEEAKSQAVHARLRADQAEQRRSQLVVNVSHELRTPVANIAGHLESLLLLTDGDVAGPPVEKVHDYLTIAYREAQRLGTLVDDLLALARMESSEFKLDLQPVLASEAIEEVYQTLMPLAQRQRQVTLVRGVARLPPVWADHQRLIQILLNLVRNAITSTPSGGIVSMTMESLDEQHVVLIVADSGIGIPEEECAHIFERFYRVDEARSRDKGGFGLGLAIVHDLVTAMGGTIMVESVVGQGTSFSICLRTA